MRVESSTGNGESCSEISSGNLRAPENDGVATSVGQLPDHLLENASRGVLDPTVHELVEDDRVQPETILMIGDLVTDTEARELGRVHRPFHEIARPEEREAIESARTSGRRDLLGDVQPRRPAFTPHEIERPMEGVVGADQQLGTRPDQLLGR